MHQLNYALVPECPSDAPKGRRPIKPSRCRPRDCMGMSALELLLQHANGWAFDGNIITRSLLGTSSIDPTRGRPKIPADAPKARSASLWTN